ncbi:MAG: isoprenylcysteine carboxylmethyltransferase family protein [Pseudomonadota bacterium]
MVLWITIALVALQRVAELIYVGRNTRALLAAGGVEVGAGHYPLIVALHASWLGAIALFVPPTASVHWGLLGFYLILQVLRLWIIVTLGRFWTTRIITLPGAPLIKHGPYRFLKHPNYLVVILEIAALPLAFGAWELAAIFSVLNGGILAYRIKVENRVLADRQDKT